MSAPAPSDPFLVAENIDAHYGRALVLLGVGLMLRPGEVAALMGRNGAGKSTTLRRIMGLVSGRSGTIRLDGQRIDHWPAHRIAAAGLGYVPEDRRIFGSLTVGENLSVGCRPPRPDAPAWTVERVHALFPALADLHGRLGSRLSGGEQQMLAVARTLMGQPRAILLDEPSEGLAPLVVEQLAEAVATLKAEGMAVLLSEQNLGFARSVSDRVYVLESGRLRFDGAMTDLAGDPALREAFLGV